MQRHLGRSQGLVMQGDSQVLQIQAVQGCGKTTLVTELQNLFAEVGLNAASVSIDDFYLTFADQQALIKASSNFPYAPSKLH